MREAIGGTWLFNLVIFFVLLFAGYMCLSINYSKAFNVKDKIINEIEHNGGIEKLETGLGSKPKDEALKNIAAYLSEVGYRNTGKCDIPKNKSKDRPVVGCNRNGGCEKASANKTYAFCLEEVPASKTYAQARDGEFIYISYYKVKVFYQLDLPVIRSVFDFNIKGDTKLLYDTALRKVKAED